MGENICPVGYLKSFMARFGADTSDYKVRHKPVKE